MSWSKAYIAQLHRFWLNGVNIAKSISIVSKSSWFEKFKILRPIFHYRWFFFYQNDLTIRKNHQKSCYLCLFNILELKLKWTFILFRQTLSIRIAPKCNDLIGMSNNVKGNINCPVQSCWFIAHVEIQLCWK